MDCEDPNKSSELVNTNKNKPFVFFTFLTIFLSLLITSVFTLYLFLSHVSLDLREDSYSLIQCNQSQYDNMKNPNSKAVVSLMTQDTADYTRYAQILGFSLRSTGKLSCEYDMIMIHSCRLKPETVQKLEFAQWKLLEINPIDFPHSPKQRPSHKNRRYLKMFSKLHIFNLTQYEGLLYIDSDAVVVNPISDIINQSISKLNPELGFNLAWGLDSGKEVSSKYNAGVLILSPSQLVFEDLVHKINILEFDATLSEQAYLNKYYENTSLSLPITMNLMPFCGAVTRSLWDSLESRIHIIHFACLKPDAFAGIYRCWWRGHLPACRIWIKYVNFFQV